MSVDISYLDSSTVINVDLIDNQGTINLELVDNSETYEVSVNEWTGEIFTSSEKAKLSGIEEGAQVNVFAWNDYTFNSQFISETLVDGGKVITRRHSSGLVYHFIPDPYDIDMDSYYSGFDGTNLTGLILTRTSV